MRTDHRANDIMRILRVIYPIPNRFIRRVFERLAPTRRRAYFGAEHPHPRYVGSLAFDVHRAHIDDALHAHQRTDGGSGNAVLPRARFGDDALFAQALRQQDLPYCVVDFVCAGMVEVFALEIDIRPIMIRQSLRIVQRRRSPHVVFE